jgi:hypothetical protein
MAQFQNAISNQVSFHITEQQYVDAMRLHSRSQLKLIPVLVMMLVVCAGMTTFSVGVALCMLVFFAAYMSLIMHFIRESIRKQYRSMPQLHGDQTVQFSEEGLVWHNSYALSKVKWPLFQRYAVDENMYLLYQGPNLFNLIPRSAFHSADQEAAFRMMLELNVRPANSAKRRKSR